MTGKLVAPITVYTNLRLIPLVKFYKTNGSNSFIFIRRSWIFLNFIQAFCTVLNDYVVLKRNVMPIIWPYLPIYR